VCHCKETVLLNISACAYPCAGAQEQHRTERILAFAMATNPRLGADSLLGRLFPDELFHNIFRFISSQTIVQ
jgi:hypothetical protein